MAADLARVSRPSWDGPTRELPVLYGRGVASVHRPALVAYARPIEPATTKRPWRPDLWPAAIWVPLLLSMPVLGFGLVAAVAHILAS